MNLEGEDRYVKSDHIVLQTMVLQTFRSIILQTKIQCILQKYFHKLIFDFSSKNGQMLSLMKSSISVRKRRVLGIRNMEQHRLASSEMQHHNFRCNARILKQACMLISVLRLLGKRGSSVLLECQARGKRRGTCKNSKPVLEAIWS